MAARSSYAILLRAAGRPNAEAIRRAFRSFQHLTDADAIRLAANAQGILMRHLGVDEAKAFQQVLSQEGVKAALVKDEELRFLPECQQLHRIELTPDALMIYDYLGRVQAVAWREIALVAAGAVPHVEISSVQTPKAAVRSPGLFGLWPKPVPPMRSRLETERQLILELVVGHGAARYEIQAQDFPFNLVAGCPAAPVVEKFVWLVQELAQRTPQAVLNRGALDVRDGVMLVRGYPSRQQLLDEMIWLLWSRAHGGVTVAEI